MEGEQNPAALNVQHGQNAEHAPGQQLEVAEAAAHAAEQPAIPMQAQQGSGNQQQAQVAASHTNPAPPQQQHGASAPAPVHVAQSGAQPVGIAAFEPHLPLTPTVSYKASKPPPSWDPSKQPWTEYSATLAIHFIANKVPTSEWGVQGLTFVPNSVHSYLLHTRNITEISAETFTWDDLRDLCTKQQVAYLETDQDLHTKLANIRQYNDLTNTTTPLALHLGMIETHIHKFQVKIADTTAIWFVTNSIHPAAQYLLRLDPVGKPFTDYQTFREFLINNTANIDRAIKDYMPRRGQPSTSTPTTSYNPTGGWNASKLTHTTPDEPGAKRRRLESRWTPEQRALAAKGLCVYCRQPFDPTHRCRNNPKVGRAAVVPSLLYH